MMLRMLAAAGTLAATFAAVVSPLPAAGRGDNLGLLAHEMRGCAEKGLDRLGPQLDGGDARAARVAGVGGHGLAHQGLLGEVNQHLFGAGAHKGARGAHEDAVVVADGRGDFGELHLTGAVGL